jgi:GntR family transcriptional regulator, transcriptional repressor for pyruvate dehydrogenase complex
MELKPIKPKRISDQVFEQVRELIYKGTFKPGQQITPERNLAASMQVSRTSVRNAINKLVTMGLLEHRQGQGTFVASPENRRGNPLAAAMATEEATLSDLLEVRLGLESNAAELAARRATEKDLIAIEESLAEMEQDMKDDGHISTNSDAAFHMAITFATKNPVLIHLMRNFYDFLFIGIKKNLTHMYQRQGEHENVLDHHKQVYEMIKKRRPEEAGKLMRQHINYVQEYFRKHNTMP